MINIYYAAERIHEIIQITVAKLPYTASGARQTAWAVSIFIDRKPTNIVAPCIETG